MVSHAQHKHNLFTETSLDGETNFYLSFNSLLYILSKLSLKQVNQNKLEVTQTLSNEK